MYTVDYRTAHTRGDTHSLTVNGTAHENAVGRAQTAHVVLGLELAAVPDLPLLRGQRRVAGVHGHTPTSGVALV